MDTDDLTEKAYEIIVAAARVSDTLKAELGALSRHCDHEDDWLRGVKAHLQAIAEDPEDYVDSWSLDECEGVSPKTMGNLAARLCRKVDEVLGMPLMERSRKGAVSTSKKTKKKPTWIELKRKLARLDQAELLGLIQDLYEASKDNQAFLHTRFALGHDVLKPYKDKIARWVFPDVLGEEDISVSKAKKAISDYKKALGRPEELVELMVYYCETATNFLMGCGMDDEGYFDALVHMFEQSLKAIGRLAPDLQAPFIKRLERVRREGHNWGWGVGDDMDDLIEKYGFDGG